MTEKLLENWFPDRNGHFVRETKTGRICWEDSIPAGGSLAETFMATSLTDKESLIKRAYVLARETLVSMNTPFPVMISVGGGSSWSSSDRKVNIATKYFDDSRLTPPRMAEIFVGLTVHEGCHVLYSDAAAHSTDRLTDSVRNIIEDERIERKLSYEKPGLMGFIAATKNYYFGEYYDSSGSSGNVSRTSRFINLLLAFIRYPKAIDKKDLNEFEDKLLECKQILTPYPGSPQESLEAAERIRKVIDGIKEPERNKDSRSKNKDTGDRKDNGTSASTNDEKVTDVSNGTSVSENYGERENTDASNDTDVQMDNAVSKNTDADMDDILSRLSRLLHDSVGKEEMSEQLLGDKISMDVIECRAERGFHKSAVIRRPKEDRDAYLKVLAEIRHLIPSVSRAVSGMSEKMTVTYTGLRSGRLDTHRLAQAVQGVPNIYCQNRVQASNRMAVCLLIDESGSMRETDGTGETRWSRARKTAILLYEALHRNPNIDLFIYGHTARMNLIMHSKYDKDVGKPWSVDVFPFIECGRGNKFTLGSIEMLLNNVDGVAITEVAARVRTFTDLPCLMFVISDGRPIYKPQGMTPEEHTRRCVEKVTKDGFIPVQVCMTKVQQPELMFRHHVKFCKEMGYFPRELGKLVKNSLLKTMKKSVTRI